ncbi:MAG: FHA domain-containing protein, partial [Planctomycetota bacterium]
MHIRDANGKTYPLERRMVVVSGEDPEMVFAVPEPRPGWCIVSRGTRFILTPLDPRLKVLVNGQNVQQRALKAGDEITVGGVAYTVSAARVKADAAVPVGNAPTGGEVLTGQAAKTDEEQLIEAGGDVVGIDMSPPAQESGDAVADLLDDVIEAWEEDEKPAWAGGRSAAERAKDRERRKPKRQERERSGRRREAIKGDDGRLDIGASIKDRIRKVDIETLAKSKQHIKLLKMDVIEELVEAAVTDTAERMGHHL